MQLTAGQTIQLEITNVQLVTAGVTFGVSQLPKYTVLDSKYSESTVLANPGDNFVYGVANAEGVASSYRVTHEGWVGVTTYTDSEGVARVKTETLVAMSGITTGTDNAYPTAE